MSGCCGAGERKGGISGSIFLSYGVEGNWLHLFDRATSCDILIAGEMYHNT